MNTEFKDALSKIDTIYKKIEIKGENILVYASVKEDNSRIFFIITNVYDYFWINDFGEDDFIAHKKSIGLEGPIGNFIFLIIQAFKKEGNNLEIKMKKSICELKIKYEVSQGVILTGTFLLTERITFENNNEMAKSLFSQILFNIVSFNKNYENEKSKQIDALNLEIQELKQKSTLLQESNKFEILNEKTKSNTKIKPKTDIVNPFKKKRKGGGVKIGSQNIHLQ